MRQRRCQERVRELIDTDPPDEVLERMTRVDALLRTLADPSPTRRSPSGEMRRRREARHGAWSCTCRAAASEIGLLAAERGPDPKPRRTEQEVKLSLAKLELIYKPLEAAKTLRIVPPGDELLEEAMQLIDQALRDA